MSVLPPFNATGVCPKCGTGGLLRRYVETIRDARYGTKAYRESEKLPAMERTCAGCGFATLEAPMSESDILVAALSRPAAQADGGDDAEPPMTFI